MISGSAVQPGSHLHGSRNQLRGRAAKGHQGARKGRTTLPTLAKSSTRSLMNHSERWLLARSRASGGLANQDNPVYRSRFHAPVPFPDHNATTPLHPAAALAARQGRTKAGDPVRSDAPRWIRWGGRCRGIRAPRKARPDRTDRLRKSLGTSDRFRIVVWACRLMTAMCWNGKRGRGGLEGGIEGPSLCVII